MYDFTSEKYFLQIQRRFDNLSKLLVQFSLLYSANYLDKRVEKCGWQWYT